MINLTTLASDIVAVILDETLPSETMLFELAAGTPVVLEEPWRRVERVEQLNALTVTDQVTESAHPYGCLRGHGQEESRS